MKTGNPKEAAVAPKRRAAGWLAVGCVSLLLGGGILRAQQTEPQELQENEEQDNTFDPLKAYQDMKVGDFYFKKGSYEAAIKRYEDAARHRPNFAIPYLKMGKAYEKKKAPKPAIEAYQKYLEILPKGKDAAEVRKRIQKLREEVRKAQDLRPKTQDSGRKTRSEEDSFNEIPTHDKRLSAGAGSRR